jgi:ribonuclease HI
MYQRHTLIVDGSYDRQTGVTGVGIAVHEADKPGRNGILIDQIAESFSCLPDGNCELLAIYRALEIGIERAYKVIRIRSDYNQLRKALKKDYSLRQGFERNDLHGEVLRMTEQFESVIFAYKPKRKNRMAHELSRLATKEKEPICSPKLIELTKKGANQRVDPTVKTPVESGKVQGTEGHP